MLAMNNVIAVVHVPILKTKKRVHHETLESLHNSVRSLQIDLRVTLKEFNDLTYIVKNEDVLKIARNEIGNLARTVKV